MLSEGPQDRAAEWLLHLSSASSTLIREKPISKINCYSKLGITTKKTRRPIKHKNVYELHG
jgi:hypothetical protein